MIPPNDERHRIQPETLPARRSSEEVDRAREDCRKESFDRGRAWAATCPAPLLEELHRYQVQRNHNDLQIQKQGRLNIQLFSKRYIPGGIASNTFVEGALEGYRAHRA